MKKTLILVLVGGMFLSGCLVRSYTVYKPRRPLNVSGNRGYLAGGPVQEEERVTTELGDKRPVTIVELEFGSHSERAKRGEIEESALVESRSSSRRRRGDDIDEEILDVRKIRREVRSVERTTDSRSNSKDTIVYTVLQNDTLQKISQKFYGTTKKWKYLYEVNTDVMKNPDTLFPGMKLKVPPVQ